MRAPSKGQIALLGLGAVGVLAAVASAMGKKGEGAKPGAPGAPPGAGANWPPPPPGIRPLVTNEERFAAFGRFSFTPSPLASDPEHVEIDPAWVAANIGPVTVPELAGISGAPANGRILFYRRAHAQLLALFRAWREAGLMDRVLTWSGSWNPRFVRGSRTYLSNHCFGTAFDLNAQWNGYGAEPALLGQKGCVRELAVMMPAYGFWWGGWFGHKDGMHGEIYEITSGIV